MYTVLILFLQRSHIDVVVNNTAFAICSDAAACVCAAGRTTGLAVNCGYHITSVTPVYEGILIFLFQLAL
jgi:hypothetical protein